MSIIDGFFKHVWCIHDDEEIERKKNKIGQEIIRFKCKNCQRIKHEYY